MTTETAAPSPLRQGTSGKLLVFISCLLLLTQQSAEIWLRAAVMVGVGIVLYFISAAVTRRSKREPHTEER